MAEVISAVFERRSDAEEALRRLGGIGVPREAITLLARDSEGRSDQNREHHGGDAAKGALTGLGVGAGVGALVGVAALTIPGVGPFIAAGALAELLGVTAGAAASGALVGGAAGTLAGGLSRWGLSDTDARRYAAEVERGAVYVGVDIGRAPVSPDVVVEALERSNGRVERAPHARADLAPTGSPPLQPEAMAERPYASEAVSTGASPTASAGATEMRVPLMEETAQVRKIQHERGHVGVTKHVEVETRHISEPVIRTRLETETREVPADEDYQHDARVAQLRPGDTLRIAVIEEELVIQKVPRVTREVLIHARPEVEQVERDVELRRERVDVHREFADDEDAASLTEASNRSAG